MKTTFFSKIVKYFSSFPSILSENSTKLLALLISAVTGGFLVAIVIPFVLIWDVTTNGYIMTDLLELGVFLLCVGGFIFGAGANIKVPEVKEFLENRKDKKLQDLENNCDCNRENEEKEEER